MKTLYVSDLDGTLLQSDETLSDYTIRTINELVKQGVLFSYATARSLNTSRKVTQGIQVQIPAIVYNGVMVRDYMTGEILVSEFFEQDILDLLKDLFQHDIYPIVYAFIDGQERFSYIKTHSSSPMLEFIETRQGDPRHREVKTVLELCQGDIFYITCIDSREKLEPFYKRYQNKHHCLYQEDIYTHEQWLEFLPLKASKSHAIELLKEKLNCDKVVVFGDGRNDMDMFKMADESYAVENAIDELKSLATGVIGHHNDDAVAKWLKENGV